MDLGPHPRKLMIVRNDNIGDYLMFRQALNAFRRIPHFAGWHITLYGNAVWEPLAKAFDGAAFDRFTPLEAKRLEVDPAYLESLMTQVAGEGFACALNPLFSRTAASDCLIRASDAPQRIGFAGDASSQSAESKEVTDTFYTDLLTDPTPLAHESLRNQALVQALGLSEADMPPFYLALPPEYDALLPPSHQQFLGLPVFFLGGADAARRWPGERFGALAAYVLHRTGKPVVIAGGDDALEDAHKAVAASGTGIAHSFVGKTSLPQLALLIDRAAWLLTGDSSAAHFAACFDTPQVVLAVGNYAGRFLPYPFWDPERNLMLYPASIRRIRDEDRQALYYAHGLLSVHDIEAADVMAAVERLLGLSGAC